MKNFEAPRWTPIRDDALRGLWNTGISAADIGDKLGGLTKMAVIARARRLGLPPVDPAVAQRLALETRLRNRPDSIIKIARRETASFVWTDERVADAKNRYMAGEAGASIGATYGISRSAVIGKLQRIGVVRSDPARKATPTTPRHAKPKLAAPARSKSASSSVVEVAFSGHLVAFDDLKPHQCRWPIGEVNRSDFGFCGHERTGDKPYCVHHNRLAYQPFKAHEPKDGTQLARALRRWAA